MQSRGALLEPLASHAHGSVVELTEETGDFGDGFHHGFRHHDSGARTGIVAAFVALTHEVQSVRFAALGAVVGVEGRTGHRASDLRQETEEHLQTALGRDVLALVATGVSQSNGGHVFLGQLDQHLRCGCYIFTQSGGHLLVVNGLVFRIGREVAARHVLQCLANEQLLQLFLGHLRVADGVDFASNGFDVVEVDVEHDSFLIE